MKRLMIVVTFFTALGSSRSALAQTDADAIMMNKKQFCEGVTYDYSSWDHYWEGTFKRNNDNLGTVSTQSMMYMPNYGITNKLNVMAAVPYAWTKASEGTLHGLKGFQDLSLWVKWKPVSVSLGKSRISLFALGGFSTPLSNYSIDYLPLSIGLGSTNLTARGMIDYRYGRFTVTGSADYSWRSNVKLDEDSYYDTKMHLTNKIEMPGAALFQLRSGYRGRYLIAEAFVTKMNTLGGYDLTKNNGQLYPHLRMNATMIGASAKYTLKSFTKLSVVAGGNYTLSGRNVGQSKSFDVGFFYAFYFTKKPKS